MLDQKPRPGYKFVKSLYREYVEIPNDWDKALLVNLCKKKLQYGAGVSALPKNNQLPRYIRITDLNDDGSLRENEWASISEEDSESYLLSEGDILFARTGATVGKTYQYTKKDGKCAFAGYLVRCIPDEKKLSSIFLFYYTHSYNYWKWLKSVQTEGVQPNVNAEEYSQLPIMIPKKIEEQQKIASILSNVDSLMEQIQQKIEQTQRFKKGLIQRLLIKGIGHTKFKKVENFFHKSIEIPDKWDYPKFSKVVKVNPITKIDEKQVPYLPMDAIDVEKPHFNYFEERKLEDCQSLPKFQEHDVLFARITPSTENGKTCIIENFSRKGVGSSELTILRPSDEVVPKYLYYYVKSHRIRQFAISQMMGTTGRQRVPDYVFKKDLNFELPPYLEQQKIASILSNVDLKIQNEQEYKSNLENLKKGLTQNLLTGQIRVKI